MITFVALLVVGLLSLIGGVAFLFNTTRKNGFLRYAISLLALGTILLVCSVYKLIEMIVLLLFAL